MYEEGNAVSREMSATIDFLKVLSRARSIVDLNVAAGIAGQALRREWTGCPAGCQCEPCVAYLDSPEFLAANA